MPSLAWDTKSSKSSSLELYDPVMPAARYTANASHGLLIQASWIAQTVTCYLHLLGCKLYHYQRHCCAQYRCIRYFLAAQSLKRTCCMCSAHSVGVGVVHSVIDMPSSAASTFTVHVLPQPVGPVMYQHCYQCICICKRPGQPQKASLNCQT